MCVGGAAVVAVALHRVSCDPFFFFKLSFCNFGPKSSLIHVAIRCLSKNKYDNICFVYFSCLSFFSVYHLKVLNNVHVQVMSAKPASTRKSLLKIF